MSPGIVKQKYGSLPRVEASDVDNSDDSGDMQEGSDGEEVTAAVDAAVLCTLALIRKKDPTMYLEGGRRVLKTCSVPSGRVSL